MYEKATSSFARLLKIMDELREQCPWDKKQTIHTLRNMSIEELYELIDGIDNENWANINEELGDLMLHMVFYAKIGSEKGETDIHHVLETVCNKLVERHPHIYGEVKVKNEEDVKRNWERIKSKKNRSGLMSGIPNSIPSINKAQRIISKSNSVGFDWEDHAGVLDKIKEEIAEFEQEIASGDKKKQEEELGDIVFTLVNLSKHLGLDIDRGLESTNQKFMKRIKYMEEQSQVSLSEVSLARLEELWLSSKQSLL